ncbi:MAG: cohesin domain-containing protein [Candidatus Bathyarchaeia archaeon]
MPANSIWIEPFTLSFNTATTPVGFRFNVTIYTNLSVSTYAWQIYLTYNKNHLAATGCWYSLGAKSQWAGTNPTSPLTPQYGSHNATHNYVLFGESLQGQVSTPPGVYTLAIIQFEITSTPPPGQTYQSELRLDIASETSPALRTKILDSARKTITLNYGGTTYTYTSPPAPQPSLTVSPAYFISLYVGQIFTINVTIEDLESLWNLTYVEFELQYNGAVIEAQSVTEGPFLSQFGNTSFNCEINVNSVKVNITLEDPVEFPHGSGTLAVISFNTTSRPPAASTLVLDNVLLLDVEGHEIPCDISHGYYEMHEFLIHEIMVDSAVFYVATLSNGSISPVQLDISQCLLKFNITAGAVGFVNITIPNNLIWAEDGWRVQVGEDEVEVIATALNETHTLLSFNVPGGTNTVYIIGTGVIPEFSPLWVMFLLTAVPPAVAVKIHLKRKRL